MSAALTGALSPIATHDFDLEVDYAVIGAGVVGLALAEALLRRHPQASLVLLERHRQLGQEVSSHNSEVVHAGIYYWNTPKKGETCRRGRELLYDFCTTHDIEHRICGKHIVAVEPAQLSELSRIAEHARQNDVPMQEVAAPILRERLRNPRILAGLWSPRTGIVDSHGVMKRLAASAESRGAILSYGSTFHAPLFVDGRGCAFSAQDGSGQHVTIRAQRLYNAAGLAAARLATHFLPDAGLAIRPCRGRYFALSSRFTGAYDALLYPLPDPAGGLGVHLTLDLSRRCRLGPDVDWSFSQSLPDDPSLYHFASDDAALAEQFLIAGQRLLPDLRADDLSPDYIGVRPKLFIGDKAHPDFLIRSSHDEAVWHLLGIESPGLTSALAIAEELSRHAAI